MDADTDHDEPTTDGTRLRPWLTALFVVLVFPVNRVRLAAKHPASVLDLGASRQSHPTDSHPRVDDRLMALGIAEEDVEATARDVDPPAAADAIVAGRDGYERELTTWLEARLRPTASPQPAPAEAG